jgi:hypothetical protein
MILPLQKLCFVIHLVHAVVSDILDKTSAIKKIWKEFYLMLHISFHILHLNNNNKFRQVHLLFMLFIYENTAACFRYVYANLKLYSELILFKFYTTSFTTLKQAEVWFILRKGEH